MNRTGADEIAIAPAERRDAVLRFIGAARDRLLLSLFRCDDPSVIEALDEARTRDVRVRVLLTRRARGSPAQLVRLASALRGLGAEVRVFSDPVVKYHAKYMVADGARALVGSLNFTRACFTRTCDFVAVTRDPAVVRGLERLFEADCGPAGVEPPEPGTDRLIVGPGRARERFAALLGSARRRIDVIDPRLTDPAMLSLLEQRRGAGIEVRTITRRRVGGLVAHGKLLVVDERVAAIGSASLSPVGLDLRRELTLVLSDAACVAALARFAASLAGQGHGATGGHAAPDDRR